MRVQMNIIKATKKEVPAIVFLNSYVQKIHVERHPDIFKPVGKEDDLKKFFDIVLSKENNCILVGYIDSTPVGYLWATFDLEPDNPFNYEIKRVHIHQMAVHERFRRQHIGKLLFRELQSEGHGVRSWCQTLNCELTSLKYCFNFLSLLIMPLNDFTL